ncbi:hypothetical protein HK098_006600 [Nowakowskiella sp. JEL0407]|nr:hypothetical protein HK098_006600 [Nowakowskiella sp. JEL0407]
MFTDTQPAIPTNFVFAVAIDDFFEGLESLPGFSVFLEDMLAHAENYNLLSFYFASTYSNWREIYANEVQNRFGVQNNDGKWDRNLVKLFNARKRNYKVGLFLNSRSIEEFSVSLPGENKTLLPDDAKFMLESLVTFFREDLDIVREVMSNLNLKIIYVPPSAIILPPDLHMFPNAFGVTRFQFTELNMSYVKQVLLGIGLPEYPPYDAFVKTMDKTTNASAQIWSRIEFLFKTKRLLVSHQNAWVSREELVAYVDDAELVESLSNIRGLHTFAGFIGEESLKISTTPDNVAWFLSRIDIPALSSIVSTIIHGTNGSHESQEDLQCYMERTVNAWDDLFVNYSVANYSTNCKLDFHFELQQFSSIKINDVKAENVLHVVSTALQRKRKDIVREFIRRFIDDEKLDEIADCVSICVHLLASTQKAHLKARLAELLPEQHWQLEIRVRGLQHVPRDGPVLVVAAPHANQFIDPMILWTHFPRRVSFLAAKKTMDKRGVGFFARAMNSIAVQRPQDLVTTCDGLIHLREPLTAPLIIHGRGTHFTKQLAVKDTIVLPGRTGSSEVAEIISDTELRLMHPFTNPNAVALLTREAPVSHSGSLETPDTSENTWTGAIQRSYSSFLASSWSSWSYGTLPTATAVIGSSFKKIPFVDQSKLMRTVIDKLYENGVIGIFPEGGSHDRPEFLPLKAGAALMALGTMALNPSKPVKIVPVGMSYFNPHRFRSRAVIEFGESIIIKPVQVQMFQHGGDAKKLVVAELLDKIKTALKAITVTAPDYDTLTIMQAARRLYNSMQEHRSLAMNLYVTRYLIKGYLEHKSDPRVQSLAQDLRQYDKRLRGLGIKDHEVDTIATIGGPRALGLFIYRFVRLMVLLAFAFPGGVLIAPVAVIAKIVSIQKAQGALKESSVKLRGYDVIGTWKILIAAALLPAFFFVYTAILFYLIHKSSTHSPIPPSYRFNTVASIFISVLFFFGVLPFVGYATVRLTEVAVDVARSLWSLMVATIFPHQDIVNLRRKREELKVRLAEIVREFGPIVVGNNAMINFGLEEGDPQWQYVETNTSKKPNSRRAPSRMTSVRMTLGESETESEDEDEATKKPFRDDGVSSSDEELENEDRMRTITRWVNATSALRESESPVPSPNHTVLPMPKYSPLIGRSPPTPTGYRPSSSIGDNESVEDEAMLAEFDRLKKKMTKSSLLLHSVKKYVDITKKIWTDGTTTQNGGLVGSNDIEGGVGDEEEDEFNQGSSSTSPLLGRNRNIVASHSEAGSYTEEAGRGHFLRVGRQMSLPITKNSPNQ